MAETSNAAEMRSKAHESDCCDKLSVKSIPEFARGFLARTYAPADREALDAVLHGSEARQIGSTTVAYWPKDELGKGKAMAILEVEDDWHETRASSQRWQLPLAADWALLIWHCAAKKISRKHEGGGSRAFVRTAQDSVVLLHGATITRTSLNRSVVGVVASNVRCVKDCGDIWSVLAAVVEKGLCKKTGHGSNAASTLKFKYAARRLVD